MRNAGHSRRFSNSLYFPTAAKRDPVVDLGDFVQGARLVLRDEQNAVFVGRHEDRAATGDSLAGVVSAVFHDLLWRDIAVGHRHGVRVRLSGWAGISELD